MVDPLQALWVKEKVLPGLCAYCSSIAVLLLERLPLHQKIMEAVFPVQGRNNHYQILAPAKYS